MNELSQHTGQGEIILYQPDETVRLEVRLEDDTVWLTTNQMAELFQTTRNRNTLEYIGIWEKFYNPAFNYGEFATIKSQAGLNSFKISVKEFVSKTNAISLQAKAGRYGGTYAHKENDWLNLIRLPYSK